MKFHGQIYDCAVFFFGENKRRTTPTSLAATWFISFIWFFFRCFSSGDGAVQWNVTSRYTISKVCNLSTKNSCYLLTYDSAGVQLEFPQSAQQKTKLVASKTIRVCILRITRCSNVFFFIKPIFSLNYAFVWKSCTICYRNRTAKKQWFADNKHKNNQNTKRASRLFAAYCQQHKGPRSMLKHGYHTPMAVIISVVQLLARGAHRTCHAISKNSNLLV